MLFLNLLADPQMRLVFFIVFGCCFIPIFAMIMIVFFKMVFKHHKKMRTAAKKLNSNYLEYFGEDNVLSVSKNLSRVTVEVKDVNLVNLNALKHSLTEYLNQLIYSKTDRKPIVIPVFMPIET